MSCPTKEYDDDVEEVSVSPNNEAREVCVSPNNEAREVCVSPNNEEKNRKKYGRPASLKNIGANCYLNSALQGLSSCDNFVDDLHAKYNDLLEKNKEGLKKMEVLNNLIRTLNGKDDSSARSLDISRNPIFRHWNKSGQQDSFELLSYMINQVFNEIRQFLEDNNEIKKSDINAWIKEVLPLRIKIEYEMTCFCNTNISTPEQTDLALHIPITKTNDVSQLSDLLTNFFEPDQIIGYVCDTSGCDGKQAMRRPRLIPELPKTFGIHLQRSYWTGKSMKKINSRVEFSEELIIKPEYMSGYTNFNDIWKNNDYNKSENTFSIINGNDSGIINESFTNDENFGNGITSNKTDLDTNNSESIDMEEKKKEEDASSNSSRNKNVTESNDVKEKKNEQDDSNNLDIEDDSCSTNENNCDRNDVQSSSSNNKNDLALENSEANEVKNKKNDDSNFSNNLDIGDDSLSTNQHNSNENIHETTIFQTKNSDTTLSLHIKDNKESRKEDVTESNDKINNQNSPSVETKYKLTSVIVHSGDVQGGHYVCYRRSEEKWFKTNDSIITDSSWNEVKKVQAYILFYEKI